MNTLTSAPTATVLDRLFEAANWAENRLPTQAFTRNLGEVSAAEKADALENAYMPVSKDGCRLLYSLVRAIRPKTVVEFGTSYGISTIHLAAGVADNGVGHVWTTELNATKVAAARQNFEDAGLAASVTLLPGDALETLATVPGPIDLVLLDGWKDLYLPLLRLLEDRLAPGALVLADDSAFPTMADYLAYVRDPAHGYVTVEFPVEDGMEISCRA